MRTLRRTAVALLLPLLFSTAPAARAQPPSDDWRTLELPHFRVHYPAASEAWARRAAARLEAVRARLEEEVGYAPPQVVDVIVSDPLSRPNGAAWPFLGNPRMVLWTTPPAPASTLGDYRDWGELVALHEDVHLVHLLRPSRDRIRDRLARLVPVAELGPIARRAPRWVSEGYATLLEGRLTGAGRPFGDLRAAVLRQRARAGRLPSYGALGAGDESWLGASMAYLAGSAYLEWLEERAGPDALRDLWARMTARHDRSFDDAFRGVFGDGPAELYGRFTAELTWRALEAERRVLGTPGGGGPREVVEGELWADLDRGTGAPALSPDGSHLAAVLDGQPGDGEPPRLVVWKTAVDEAAEARWREERERIARDDPDDVPAVRSTPPAHEVVATLPVFDGRAPADPRWSRDGESLVFWALGRGPDGVDRADLYRWRAGPDGGGGVERLTRGADLRYPEPLPTGDGDAIVAVRSRHGLSQLVLVEIAGAAPATVTPLNEPSATSDWATPRASSDGRRLAAVVHRDGRWRLVVFELGSDFSERRTLGTEGEVPTAEGTTVADSAWGPDGTLYASIGDGGFFELRSWAPGPEGTRTRALTRTLGAALAPAPTPDGEAVFFLSLEHDGFDLRTLALADAAERDAAAAWPVPDGHGARFSEAEVTELAPAVAPMLPPMPAVGPASEATAHLPDDRPYGAGPLAVTPLVGLAATSGGQAFEAGVALGDPVGRLDGFLLGSLGRDGAIEGTTLAAAWRGWPVELTAQLFTVTEEPSAQDGAPTASGRAPSLDRGRDGLYAAARWGRDLTAGSLATRLGLYGGRVEPARRAGETLSTRSTTLSTALAWAPSRGRWRLPVELALRLQEGATDFEGDAGAWRRGSLRAALGVGRGDDSLSLAWTRHTSEDLRYDFDRFQIGGVARSLLPGDVDFARVEAPALPTGALIGDEHESQRVDLTLDFLPVPLFWERHRVWNDGARKSGWLSLAGVEADGALPPMPILGLPAARWTAGAAYVLEDPVRSDAALGIESLQDEIRLWGALVWRP